MGEMPILGIFEHKPERLLVMEGEVCRGMNFIND